MRTRIGVVVTVMCTVGAVGAAMLRGAAATERPAVAKLGFYPGYGSAARLNSLDAWLGRNTRYVVQFADAANASQFEASIWGQTVFTGSLKTIASRTTLVESVPLTFGLGFGASKAQHAAALNATLAGRNDAAYRAGAQHLKNAGFNGVVIRLGWEFDGAWMPWSAVGNEALWARTFRHVHDVFKSVLPNARFDWNGDPRWMQGELAAYPGDGYVDIIGLDVYDKGLQAPWNPSTLSWSDPSAAFDTDLPSLIFQRDFAIAHGKQVSYPEWALSSGGAEAANGAGSDDPTFIQRMYDWMNSLPGSGPGSLAYHSYFNEDAPNDGNHVLSHFPNAQNRFRALFGGGVSTASAPTWPVNVHPCASVSAAAHKPGYSLLAANGMVYSFGGACNAGHPTGLTTGIATRADGKGYWVVDAFGNVSHFGSATNHGGHPTLGTSEIVTAISATRTGNGYWLFSSKGRVYAYGDAHFYGDMRAKALNGSVIASAATPTSHGYYMVGSDGGVFNFGDARFRGSMGGTHLNKPIVGLSSTTNGRGYWLVASDGGVFAFAAPFRGSMGSRPLVEPVNGLVAYGNGYLMVASDGGVFDFSDKAFSGSLGNNSPSAPIVGIAAVGH